MADQVGLDMHPVYQRLFNWAAVDFSDDPTRGVRFCWIKVSDGAKRYIGLLNGVEYPPDALVAGAKSRGIPVGAYHYAQTGDPVAQANVLIGEVDRLDARGVVPMLDLEAPFTANAAARDFGIRFCTQVLARGYRPAVYMSSSFAKVLRPDQWPVAGLVIVIARYGAKPESAGSPQYTGRYDVHQYASNGFRGGVSVDMDDAYTNNHLMIGSNSMAFSQDDFTALMWTYRFDDDGAGHTGNFASAIKSMRDNMNGLAASLANLTALVTRQSGVSAADVAAALAPVVTAAVSSADRLTDQDEQDIAKHVTDRLSVMLTAPSGGAV